MTRNYTINVFLPGDESPFLNEGMFTFGEAVDHLWTWISAGLRAELEYEVRDEDHLAAISAFEVRQAFADVLSQPQTDFPF